MFLEDHFILKIFPPVYNSKETSTCLIGQSRDTIPSPADLLIYCNSILETGGCFKPLACARYSA